MNTLAKRLAELEKDIILFELSVNHWKRIDTAKALGISRKCLWEKMKLYELKEAKEAAT